MNTVTETALLFEIKALADLHVIEVADFHSDASHPVFPIRVDGDDPSPKPDPNTMTEIDPANAVSHGSRKERLRQQGTRQLQNETTKQGWYCITCAGLICRRKSSSCMLCSIDWNKRAGQKEQRPQRAHQEEGLVGKEA